MESTSEVVSNTVIGKHESAEDFPANTDAAKQSVEANKTNNKEPVEVPAEKGTDEGKVSVEEKKQVQQPETISETQEEDEEIVEEEDSDEDDAEDDTNQKITETKVVKTADGGQTTITTVTTVQKVSPDSTKTVVTTSSITRENSVAATTPTTTSYTSDEVETQTPETVAKSNEKVVSSDENEDKHEEEKATEEENESEGETEEENAEEEHATQQSNEKVADENKKIDDSLQRPQQPNKDQIQQETETQSEPQPTTTIMKETTEVSETDGQENKIPNRQENFNNAIRDIISGIDSNIHDQENTAALREREMELLKKQQELAEEIERHKFLTQKRSNENQQKQQQPSNNFVNKESVFPTKTYQPITNVSKYSTFEEKQDNNMYSLKSDKFETTESTSVSKKIDLHKIFTPATDVEGILPKNRKLYASSAFYSPALHPTVEDQVELARRISHSLSDISNQQSRGQSMYVNRKKRSVKWVHEGCGQDDIENTKAINEEEYDRENKEMDVSHLKKVPLKFLMNPSGQMRDINSLRESINTETGLLSPDVSAEVATALQAQTGKDYHQYQQQPNTSTSPSILPAYTDAAKHRVQLNLHQEQLLEKYAKPGLKVVQTPWEAALNSGSASAAFVEEQKHSPYPTPAFTASPTPQIFDASQGGLPIRSAPTATDSCGKTFRNADYQRYQTYSAPQQQAQHERQLYTGSNSKRELAYKPVIPQGWKAPSMSLPKGPQQDTNLVGLKVQNLTETHFTANDIKHVQQQNHITTVTEAAKSCEEFNTKDETELISLIPNDVAREEMLGINKHLVGKEVHEFINHFIKSPELRISPVPISIQVIYDNTVQELQEKQHKETKKSAEKCEIRVKESSQEDEEKVNVRKQLQQYEDLHRQYAKQIEQEELLQKKREVAKLKAVQKYNKISSQASESVHATTVQQVPEEQTNEEYVKVPVKDLITNFEQQCLQEEKLNAQPAVLSSALKEYITINTEPQNQSDGNAISNNEDLFMPKEIPLQSYAPPPVVNIPRSVSPVPCSVNYEATKFSYNKPQIAPQTESAPTYGGSTTFPVSKPYQQGFLSKYGNSQPPKQQYLPPQSYQKVPQNTNQNVPQVNFNPSPLPYDKLAKFENPPSDEGRYVSSPSACAPYLNIRSSKVYNTSPAPFEAISSRPYTPSSDSHYYGGASSHSPRPFSNMQQYSRPNPTNLSHPTGWGCGSGDATDLKYSQRHISAAKPQIVSAASMPYTDF